MSNMLVISVRLHDGVYHGSGESLPSPARLYQAIVAGHGLSGPLDPATCRILEDFERLSEASPPVVYLPKFLNGRRYVNYVPSNDLDSSKDNIWNTPTSKKTNFKTKERLLDEAVAKVRTSKEIQPRYFDSAVPFIFAWGFDQTRFSNTARSVCLLADRLYQFGRGVDLAWAIGDVMDDGSFEQLTSDYPGQVYYPSGDGNGLSFRVPATGSLKSLQQRYAAYHKRLETKVDGSTTSQDFQRLPQARFNVIAYNSPPTDRLFELRESTRATPFAVWPQAKVTALVETLRDKAVDRLKDAVPEIAADIERYMVGRRPGGEDACPTSHRIRIIPIPSIGSQFADRDIRRIYVEVPAECTLRANDVFWSLSGLTIDPPTQSQAAASINVVRATDSSMLLHFAIGTTRKAQMWRTVTPAALPESGRHRRIDPDKLDDARTRDDEAKGGNERRVEQLRAAAAVVQALRHAGISQRPQQIHVQREPFKEKGERAEEFAAGTRFSKHQLWHVEIEFNEPRSGPVVLGNGRFLGLGIMAPVDL